METAAKLNCCVAYFPGDRTSFRHAAESTQEISPDVPFCCFLLFVLFVERIKDTGCCIDFSFGAPLAFVQHQRKRQCLTEHLKNVIPLLFIAFYNIYLNTKV